MTRTNYSFVKCIWYYVKYGERHLKDQLQTALKYSGNLANTVYESMRELLLGLLTISHMTHRIILLLNKQHLFMLSQEWATLSQ